MSLKQVGETIFNLNWKESSLDSTISVFTFSHFLAKQGKRAK